MESELFKLKLELKEVERDIASKNERIAQKESSLATLNEPINEPNQFFADYKRYMNDMQRKSLPSEINRLRIALKYLTKKKETLEEQIKSLESSNTPQQFGE